MPRDAISCPRSPPDIRMHPRPDEASGVSRASRDAPKRPKKIVFRRWLKEFGVLASSASGRSETAHEAPKIALG
eukprot:8315573-Pyramimonas_sp.AAC.1